MARTVGVVFGLSISYFIYHQERKCWAQFYVIFNYEFIIFIFIYIVFYIFYYYLFYIPPSAVRRPPSPVRFLTLQSPESRYFRASHFS